MPRAINGDRLGHQFAVHHNFASRGRVHQNQVISKRHHIAHYLGVTHRDQATALLAANHDLAKAGLQFEQLSAIEIKRVCRRAWCTGVAAQLNTCIGIERLNGQNGTGTAQVL